MDLTQAFADLQNNVNVRDRADKKARRRRDVFKDAFTPETIRTFASGSLARGSQIDPINDVDMVAVFSDADKSDWGTVGSSAEDALKEVRDLVHALLGQTNGSHEKVVRQVNIRNHSVKCYLDDPQTKGAFTVDLVPALERDGHLLIPESRSLKWVASDPEFLMAEVAKKHADWPRFVGLVRMLKRWNKDNGALFKSLTIEVLALKHLNEATDPMALHKFFTAAAANIYDPVEDPAGLCGPIQRDLDYGAAYDLLDKAAGSSYHAVNEQASGNSDAAACRWREVFGDVFPAPPGGCPEPAATNTGLIIPAAAGTAGHKKIVDAPQG